MKTSLLYLLLLGLLSSCAMTENHSSSNSSSTLSIAGRVVDNRKNPVKGVQVQAEGLKRVVTNDRGEFLLTGPAPRTDSLTVSFIAPGFTKATKVYKATTRVAGNGTTVVIWPRVAGNGNTVVIWPRR
jgi:hypothetical protein